MERDKKSEKAFFRELYFNSNLGGLRLPLRRDVVPV